MTSGSAIDVRKLTLKYGSLTAVDCIDLQVPYGVIFGLLGANGAGKSSTIKMLATLLKPTSGSARVAGFDIISAPDEVRRHIGYVPQMLSADGALTGYENLLRVVAILNPLTYLVDALRGLMVHDEQSMYGLGLDCGVLLLVLFALLAIAVRLYPKLVQ
jgi:ABC-type Na+ transport system ATPase subunit NatA